MAPYEEPKPVFETRGAFIPDLHGPGGPERCVVDDCGELVSSMWDGNDENEAMCDEHHEQAAESAYEESAWESRTDR